jgi:hypothetical protein
MQWVTLGEDVDLEYPMYMVDLVDESEPWHHDSEKLASVLMDLYQARTGPLTME